MGLTPKAAAELNDINREQMERLKGLLGKDIFANNEWSALTNSQFSYLPPEKIERLQLLLTDYGELRNQVYAKAKGVLLPEDNKKIALIDKEQRADLVSLLSPAELENYDLRSSTTAGFLRNTLASFDPSEEEFRVIFKIRQAFEDKYADIKDGNASPERIKQFQTEQRQLDDNIKATLSPDRVADYERSLDPAYQNATQLLAQLDLPSSFATQIVALQKDMEQRAIAVQKDTSLNTADQDEKLAELLNEAKTKLTSTLGERGYEIYKNRYGYWLTTFQVRTNRSNTSSTSSK